MTRTSSRFNKLIGRALVYAGTAVTAATGVAGAASAETHPAPPTHIVVPAVNASVAMTTPDPSGSTLHILTGRSMFVNTVARLKRVYVSNPAVVDSFTVSPTQIVITAKTPGVRSLILWDETGKSQMYLVSSDLDVDSLQKSIEHALPQDHIQVESRQERVSLFGTVTSDASADAALKLATLYTKDVASSLLVAPPHIKQVKLKVQIVEVDRSKLDAFGINLFSAGKELGTTTTGQFPSVTSASSSSSSGSTGSSSAATLSITDPLNMLLYDSGLNIGLTLKDLQNRQILQILAEPTITTVSGQKASFLSGGEFPFPVIQGGAGQAVSVTLQFRQYGVKVDFTPVVNPDGTIQLKVVPEVSSLDFTNAVQISGYTIPALSTRRADTQVELRDGQSFAISGLLDHRTTDQLNKMPGIGDVPILGQLFRSKSLSHSVVELIVVVTPSVIDPLNDNTTPILPKMAVPNLEKSDFDKKVEKKKPAEVTTAQPK